MKKLILFSALLVLSLSLSLDASSPTTVTLAWDPYTNSPPDLFKLYSSTNVAAPMTNWVVLTNIAATIVILGVTNPVTSVSLSVMPAQYFFALTASNFWGESGFSNAASTPPAPTNPTNVTIRRGN